MREYNHKISERANKSLKKREAVVRRQRQIFAAALILIASLGVLLGTSMNTLASSKADVSSYHKYYKSVRIETGDSLWTIADDYIVDFDISKPEYIAEVCELNDITENEIHAGDYIIVPYYSQEVK